MAAAAVNNRAARLVGVAAALAMVAVLAGISFTGRWPTDASLERVTGNGIITLPAEQIARVEVSAGDRNLVFEHRAGGGWAADGTDMVAAENKHIDNAIRFLNVSDPRRTMHPGEYNAAKIIEFGLDPPKMLVSLVSRSGKRNSITFGEETPAANSQFVHVLGRPTIDLLSRYVGVEWQIALEMAERSVPAVKPGGARPSVLFLPMTFANIWAVEIVEAGALMRFERDPAGDWFRHVGHHVHKPGGFVHKADPKKAPLIAEEFAALQRASIELVIARHPDPVMLAKYGLDHPSVIMMLYARDLLGAVARVEFGKPTPDGFARYARVSETDSIVTVPRYVAAHVSRLLQIAGGKS